MGTVFIWGNTVSSASGLRGNTFGDVLLLNYLPVLWRESCTQGAVSACKRNKQVHATKPGSVARTSSSLTRKVQVTFTQELTVVFCSQNIAQSEKKHPLKKQMKMHSLGITV